MLQDGDGFFVLFSSFILPFLPPMQTKDSTFLPTALAIGGSDSGGGAGIQADLLSLAANGVYATCAITCLTAQNPDGVSGVFPVSPGFVLEQARQVVRYFKPGAIKTGMLLNREIISAVAVFVREQRGVPFVLDPVMVATSGARLLEEEAVEAMGRELFPAATLITPNLDEAAVLLGHREAISSGQMVEAARALQERFGCAVLLKGGHLNAPLLRDVLVTADGDVSELEAVRRADTDTHGSGCTLAAAVAAHLALGKPLHLAVAAGHAYLQAGVHAPVHTTKGNFIAHLRKIGDMSGS
jgi:hydroxymethylpyrimidine kinase/phosphomethylpyrimidine kinase